MFCDVTRESCDSVHVVYILQMHVIYASVTIWTQNSNKIAFTDKISYKALKKLMSINHSIYLEIYYWMTVLLLSQWKQLKWWLIVIIWWSVNAVTACVPHYCICGLAINGVISCTPQGRTGGSLVGLKSCSGSERINEKHILYESFGIHYSCVLWWW